MTSYHCAVKLHFVGEQEEGHAKKTKIGQIRALEVQDVQCAEIVKNTWRSAGHDPRRFMEMQEDLKFQSNGWGKQKLGKLHKSIDQAQRRIEQLIKSSYTEHELQGAYEKLNKFLAFEQDHWKVRSKSLWLKDGEKKTLYFHYHPSHRHRRNHISSRKNDQGSFVS